MESNGPSSSSSSASDNHSSSKQSQWLQVTLSDMNNKMRTMMTLLEEDGNSSVRIENYDERRLQLFQMLEEFNNSYCSLAEKYDQLRSKLCRITDSGSITSSSSSNNRTKLVGSPDGPKQELSGSCLDSLIRESNVDRDNTKIDLQYLEKLVKELMSMEPCDMKMKNHDIRAYHCNEKHTEMMTSDDNLAQYQATNGDVWKASSEKGNAWCELNFQLTKLTEENLRQLAELARRNIEKKVIINRLRLQIEHLKGENRDLQSCISKLKDGDRDKQFQMSKLKRMFSGKRFD